MELDDLKSNWKSVNERLAMLEKKVAEQERRSRDELNYHHRSALEKLIGQYRRMSFLCLLLGVLYLVNGSLTLAVPNFEHGISAVMSWWLQLYMSLFLIVAAVYDRMIISRLRTIRIWEMSVMQVSNIATHCRRLHHRWMMGAIPVAILFLILLYIDARGDQFFVKGMILGGIVGMVAGTFIYRRMMREYRRLIRTDDLPLNDVDA